MRTLFLVCYDISCDRRRYKIQKMLLQYSVSRQKSLYECWMTKSELSRLEENIRRLIEPADDRVHIFQLDPRLVVQSFGMARRQSITPFLMV